MHQLARWQRQGQVTTSTAARVALVARLAPFAVVASRIAVVACRATAASHLDSTHRSLPSSCHHRSAPP